MDLSSMLSRGMSRRQLSSVNSQCEAISRGLLEWQSERQSCLSTTERLTSELSDMDLSLKRFPAPARPSGGGFEVTALRQRQILEEETARKELEQLEELQLEIQNQQATAEKLLEIQQLEMEEKQEIHALCQRLSSRDFGQLEHEQEMLREEELLQEDLVLTSRLKLEERQEDLAESNTYWDAVPFLSTETGSCDEWQRDLMLQQMEMKKLEEELRTSEEMAVKRAQRERRQENQEPRPSENLLKLSELQGQSWQNSQADLAKLESTQARLKDDLSRLQSLASNLSPTELHSVLAATGTRTVEHMKDLLKKDLVVMQELQVALRDRNLHCDKERKLRRALERRLAEEKQQWNS